MSSSWHHFYAMRKLKVVDYKREVSKNFCSIDLNDFILKGTQRVLTIVPKCISVRLLKKKIHLFLLDSFILAVPSTLSVCVHSEGL